MLKDLNKSILIVFENFRIVYEPFILLIYLFTYLCYFITYLLGGNYYSSRLFSFTIKFRARRVAIRNKTIDLFDPGGD